MKEETIRSEILRDNYLEVISDEDELKRLEKGVTGWKVLFTTRELELPTFSFFKTNDKGWVSEFWITVTTIYDGKTSIVLVSPECPEYLFIDPTDLIKPLHEYWRCFKKLTMEKLNHILNRISANNIAKPISCTVIDSYENGSLLMSNDGKLFVYDSDSSSTKWLQINN